MLIRTFWWKLCGRVKNCIRNETNSLPVPWPNSNSIIWGFHMKSKNYLNEYYCFHNDSYWISVFDIVEIKKNRIILLCCVGIEWNRITKIVIRLMCLQSSFVLHSVELCWTEMSWQYCVFICNMNCQTYGTQLTTYFNSYSRPRSHMSCMVRYMLSDSNGMALKSYFLNWNYRK